MESNMAAKPVGSRKRTLKMVLVKRLQSKKRKFEGNKYICALIHCTVKKLLEEKTTRHISSSMDADQNFHSVDLDYRIEDIRKDPLNLDKFFERIKSPVHC
jgi:hypothetical protein